MTSAPVSADRRDVIIRQANVDDGAAIAGLEAAAFGSASWGAAGVHAALMRAENRALVGMTAHRDRSEAVAFGIWRLVADEAEILSIGVAPAERRRGLGRRLLQAVLETARRARATRLFLEVDSANTAAVSLYEAAGFHAVGARTRYYRNGGDAIIMLKSLN
ncbi:MAG: ribosomal protein S18-alanine N-acetyltransferase [Pseudomonadota bacterium]